MFCQVSCSETILYDRDESFCFVVFCECAVNCLLCSFGESVEDTDRWMVLWKNWVFVGFEKDDNYNMFPRI